MSALSLDAGAVWAGNEAIKELAELRADLADSRLIAREQENAHVAANMRNTHLEDRISALAASVDRLTSDKARLAAELARIHKHDHIAELKDRIGALEAALSDLTYLHPDSNKWATAREHARTLVGSEPETGTEHET